MAEIKIEIDFDQDLTVFNVSGSLVAGELLESTRTYRQGKTTRQVLCDFTNATWGGLQLRISGKIPLLQSNTLLRAIDMPLSSPLIWISEWVECLLLTPRWRSMLVTLAYFDRSMMR